MKTKLQKEITLDEIVIAFNEGNLETARQKLLPRMGSTLKLFGTVLKINRGVQRLHLEVEMVSARPMEAFCNFSDEFEFKKTSDANIRKNSSVSIFGTLRSFGESAINLVDCRLE